jgi:hypothetical protein
MAEYTGPDRRGNGGWHMSKSLSVSHLFTTLAIAVGFFTYVTGIEQETVINKQNIINLSERVARSDARHGEQFSEIKTMLEKISDRLNSLSMRERRD